MQDSVVLVLCRSPEPAAFPQLTHVKYLHTAQLVRCWEQIGNRITDSISNQFCSEPVMHQITKAEENYQLLVSLDTIH